MGHELMKSDERLMSEYREGSEEAFNLLYERYSTIVYSYLKKRLKSNESEDIYQKVWRHLHEKRALYNGQSFAPWFFVLMRNLLFDEYRKLGRRKSHELQDELLDKIYADLNTDRDLDEILSPLPEESQVLIKKYYLEGLSYEDLEKDYSLSQTTLRQRLSRAMKVLRKNYEK